MRNFQAQVDGMMRSTSPATQPQAFGDLISSPHSARSWVHADTPKNGRPFFRTASSSAAVMPSTASSPRRQSAKAPTPGSTTRSALAHGRIARYDDWFAQTGILRSALERLAAECKLPEP